MIEKKLHCIWIWMLPPPMKRIKSRQEKHPSREYKLWGNEDLKNEKRENKKAIDYYASKGMRSWVADCMRYEILYKHGWAMHGADSLCINPIDELFEDWEENYAVDTSHREWMKVMTANINSVAPLYACKSWSSLARKLIDEIWKIKVFLSPPRTVGNRLMQKVLNEWDFKIKLWPQHYFLPEHYNWRKYEWPDKIFAKHYRGTTHNTYSQWLE